MQLSNEFSAYMSICKYVKQRLFQFVINQYLRKYSLHSEYLVTYEEIHVYLS